jgi:FkbM family methyltransferase
MIKKIFKKIKYLYKIILSNNNLQISYSQEGEDLILKRIFSKKKNGIFIDIGAHHPTRFSNTYIFYLSGWKGINIDPNPGIMDIFNKVRPNDINLELGISKSQDFLTYYQFNEPALNTFSKEEAVLKENQNKGLYKIINQINIKTFPINVILDNYLKKGTIIDFMTIDVEGLDLEVLKSNNWEKYRPTYILVEELRSNITDLISNSEINSFLVDKNYSFYHRTYNTSFYKDNFSN